MQKNIYVERVLILFNEDGSVLSAQQDHVERIYDEEGNLYAEKRLETSPIETIDILNKLNGEK